MNIPLKSVDIQGEICDSFGYVTATYVYHNAFESPIEVGYKFCLDSSAVIDSFCVRIGDREIKGTVQEKTKAKETYNTAISENKRASILEKHEDTYTVTLGNVQSNESIVIMYTYLCKLKAENGKYMFVLPTNIGTRYGDDHFDYKECGIYNTKWYEKPVYNPSYEPKSRTVSLKITCKSKNSIKNIHSLTNKIDLNKINDHIIEATSFTLPENGDFNLFMETENSSCVYHTTVKGQKYFMATHRIEDEKVDDVCKEYLFLLDRSGSMEGQKIKDAILALKKTIELLSENSYFNVVSFGYNYSAMFNKSVIANKSNKTKANNILSTYSANMGGTELLNCLKACFENKFNKFEYVDLSNVTLGLEKIFVFLTDGQINNQTDVFNLIKKNQDNVRIFSIGIGRDASRELVEKISELTNSTSKMIIDSSSVSNAISEIMVYMGKKYYKNLIAIVNGYAVDMLGPKNVYPGQTITVFFTIPDEALEQISLSGFWNTEQKQWELDINNTIEMDSEMLQKLYINELINSGTLSDQQIIELSVKYNIMNTLTSFVMVDTVTCEQKNDKIFHVNVPQSNIGIDLGHTNTRIATSYACATACAASCGSAPRSSEAPCLEEVDALDGGMDFFGGGGSYTTCSYEILNYVKPDGSFEFTDYTMNLVRYKLYSENVEKLKTYYGIKLEIIFYILVSLYIEKMENKTKAKPYIDNLHKWLNNNYKDYNTLSTQSLIKELNKYVSTPITVHGGDY